jgi:hypothetical protein
MSMPRTRPPHSWSRASIMWALAGLFVLGAHAAVPTTPASAVTASAATAGAVSLSPTKVSASVSAGPYVIPITVTDKQESAVQVDLSATGLGQKPDGTPLFTGVTPAPTSIGTTRFGLAPGQSRTVPVTVTVGRGTAGVYEAVLATISPAQDSTSGIGRQARIASLIELTGPAVGAPAATIAGIAASETRKTDQVTFSASIRDSGNVLIAPTGTATIAQNGKTLAVVPLTIGRIVPGAAVSSSGVWDTPHSPNGAVDVHIHLTDPSADATHRIRFTAGAAPLAAARITTLTADPTRSGARIRLQITNTGSTQLPATITSTTFDGHTTRTLTTDTCQLRPGRSCALARTIALTPGSHIVSVTVRNGTTVLDQRQTTITVTTGVPITIIVLGIVGIILALAAIALTLVIRTRRANR